MSVAATVTITVTDNNGVYFVEDQPVEDVKAYIERVENLIVETSLYCGPISIFFAVRFETGEFDGFTRYYMNRQHIETV